MKCPYCGGEIGNSDICEFCHSRISYKMKRELEQLNKKGCPKCGSSNVSFEREQEGETWTSGSKKYIRRTVGVCHDCGYTWFTDLPDDNPGSEPPEDNIKKEGFPLKKVIWIIAVLLVIGLLLGHCHGGGGDNPEGEWPPKDDTVTEEGGTVAEEGTTEAERELNIITVKLIDHKELEIPKAEIISYKGKITKEDQDDVYSFTPDRKGTYRLELSGIRNKGDMRVSIYNPLGERMYSTYAGNGEGLTVTDLKKDKKYKIHVTHDEGLSPYILSIAKQKKKQNISSYTLIKDSIEFTDQDNIYSFTAPLDGQYRFEFSEIHDNKDMYLSIYNDLGEKLKGTYAGNNEGLTIKLERGEKYAIHASEDSGFSSYNLKIGKQKGFTDISQYDGAQDSIEYTDQDNVYLYTASNDGGYDISLSEMRENAQVSVSVYNRLGERMGHGYCENGDALSIDSLEEGETYEFHVEYEDGPTPYRLTILQE